jgi:hypothetical protein
MKPNTEFSKAAIAAAPKDSFSAASVRGDTRICQKPASPSDHGFRTNAQRNQHHDRQIGQRESQRKAETRQNTPAGRRGAAR